MSSAAKSSKTNGDRKWQRIINDPRPRPALSVLGDEIAAQFKKNSGASAKMHDAEMEDDLEFTPKFESAIQKSEREMAAGIRPRVRQP